VREIEPGDGVAPRYLRAVLVRWYRTARRDLPWRRTSDPYRIWTSEAMLQQTRVATAIPYYERFIESLPDIPSLARADEERVLALWSGLGYYRRARFLKRAAEIVVGEYGGKLPADIGALRSLPGIGRYTAGAILSIAFGMAEPVLDGNVFRVYSRFFARRGSWQSGGDRTRFWELAERLVPGRNAGDFNQALMELGALVCTPKSPACTACPVRRRCAAYGDGDPERYPEPRVRPVTKRLRKDLYLLFDGAGRVLLRRRPDDGRMAGMWELPDTPPASGARGEKRGSFRHSILDRRYEVDVWRPAPRKGRGKSGGCFRWVAREDLTGCALTAMTKKALERG